MGFSGVGIWEILVILVIAFIVLGPNKVPGIAKKIGQTIRAIKKASSDLTTSLTREIEAKEAEEPRSHLKPADVQAAKETPPASGKSKVPADDDQAASPGEKHQDD